MFAKLLKYDMRSLRRIGLPILIAILAAAVLGSVCLALAFSIDVSENTGVADGLFMGFSMMALGFGIMMAILVMIGGVSVMSVFIYVHFYKNLITDEGYLTFTLPVRSKDIIFSKLVSSVLWSLLATVAVILGAVMMVITGCLFSGESLSVIIDGFGELVSLMGGTEVGGIFMTVLSILNVIVGAVTSILLYFLAIFLGSVIVKKNKVLAAIGLVIAFNFAYSIVYNLITLVVGVVCGVAANTSSYLLAFNIGLLFQLIFIAGAGVLFFYLLKYLMDKKLNLA